MTKIKCDKCNEVFELKIKVKKYSGSIEETYFKCPHCKERYSSYFTNESIRAKQKTINKLWKQFSNSRDNDGIIDVDIKDEIVSLKSRIKSEMEVLKNKMSEVKK